MSTLRRFYVTTAIPYVNADPHLGHALELVQADALARHRRLRGDQVRFLTGTDDNALKNVVAARAAGVPVAEFVAANAARFAGLRAPLALSFDDFIRTGADPRHAAGVHRLWERCAARGDFYRRRYQGLYCGGCEQFLSAGDLVDGCCPEHGVPPEPVSEENWFFRLSRYRQPLLDLLDSGRVRIEPSAKRNEVLAFVRSGLDDVSVSRPAARAGGWGVPMPGDPDQVIYVWWDALANYITALSYPDGADYARWWAGSAERVHLIGKGILRFHTTYWLATLLSGGQPLPTAILVHDYLTVNGAKLSKTAGNSVDPLDLVDRYGVDAVRWWLLRDVAGVGDTDFTDARLLARANTDLANGVGNLVHRTLTLASRHRLDRRAPAEAVLPGCEALPKRIDEALHRGDFREATESLCAVVAEANRFIEASRPWHLPDTELKSVLATLLHACRVVTTELSPFLPTGATLLGSQLDAGPDTAPTPVFQRLGR